MRFSPSLLLVALLASLPALAEAREYRVRPYDYGYMGNGGYAEDILTDERHREPVYELRSDPRYYAPRRTYRDRYYAPTYSPPGGRMLSSRKTDLRRVSR